MSNVRLVLFPAAVILFAIRDPNRLLLMHSSGQAVQIRFDRVARNEVQISVL
jgi:hypothetical protein